MTREEPSPDPGQQEAALDERLARSPSDLARYIDEVSGSLSRLAREANLDLLAHLLDVARLEAVQRGGGQRGRGHA